MRWILHGVSFLPVLFAAALACAGAFLASGLSGEGRPADLARAGATVGCMLGGSTGLVVGLAALRLNRGGPPRGWWAGASVTASITPATVAGSIGGILIAQSLAGASGWVTAAPVDALIPAAAPLGIAAVLAWRATRPQDPGAEPEAPG